MEVSIGVLMEKVVLVPALPREHQQWYEMSWSRSPNLHRHHPSHLSFMFPLNTQLQPQLILRNQGCFNHSEIWEILKCCYWYLLVFWSTWNKEILTHGWKAEIEALNTLLFAGPLRGRYEIKCSKYYHNRQRNHRIYSIPQILPPRRFQHLQYNDRHRTSFVSAG